MAILVAILVAVLGFIGLYITPILLLLPVPFIVFGIKYEMKYNIVSMILSIGFMTLIMGISMSLVLAILFVPLSIFIQYTIEKEYKSSHVLLFGAGIVLISLFLRFIILEYTLDIDVTNEMEVFIRKFFENSMKNIENRGLSNNEVLQFRDMFKSVSDYLVVVIPTMIIVFSFIISYINLLLLSIILNKIGYKKFKMGKFMYFRLPSNIILGSAVMLIGSFIIKYLKILNYNTIFMNMSFILSIVFFLQGLSLIIYWVSNMKVNKAIKIIVMIIVIINIPFLSGILSMLGVIDVIFDFRKLKKA
ncbi:DUF2232 domain-containing protein [Dethiothermospora halolimnae]|uniref:DUF2232 domain-containing protein n=1 Tax=Dethiothermospora halolimnae TaxID=3114390 RepID=UPI003CCBC8F7